ncbi:MAG: DUF11 domain-containing protein [Solirubrobacteraceae bacterium]
MPGFPGEPQPPTTIYSEGFENGVGRSPVALTAYTGGPPLLEKYTAASAFLKNCDGNVVEFESNERTKATDCEEVAFDRVRQLAWVLGKLEGVDPTTNHAVTAYTDGGGTLPANAVQFETVMPIPLAASSRFITFSVDAAETNCKHSHAEFKFYLLSGSLEIPTFTSPIDPCSDKSSTTFEPPKLGTKVPEPFKAGTFAGNAATLFSGSQLGIRMRNGQTSEDGNDASFDKIKVLDATPQLDKSFSPAVLSVGGVSQLTFTITNTSELAAKNGWAFTDTLPSGLVVASDPDVATTCVQPTTVKAAAGGRTISVTGDLAAGVSYCTVAIDVTSGTAGVYKNGPEDISGETGINPPGPAIVDFTPNADLQIEKSASPNPAIPGSQETYTLDVTNKGPDTAENVLVTDQLPAGLSLSSASPGCQVVASAPTKTRLPHSPRRRRLSLERGPRVQCSLGSLALGAHVTIVLTVQIASTVTEGFVNVAVVSSTTPDPELSNNAAEADTPVPPAADLAIQKTASLATVPAGGQVSYTLLVKNNGPNEATNVVVLDPLPAGLEIVSALPSQGECTTGNGVICKLGVIADGGGAQILVTANVAASAAGKIDNTAVVAGGQVDPDPSNNTSSTSIEVTPLTPTPPPPLPPPLPAPPSSEALASITTLDVPNQLVSDLRVLKHVNHTTAHVGERLTYTLKVTNDGPDAAPNVQLTDTSSLDSKILSVHTPSGSCQRGQPLKCSLGTLRLGETLTITVVATVERAGHQRNTAKVTSSNRDPNLANNQSSAETDITARARPAPIVTG